MWISTYTGIDRFDGHSFKQFPLSRRNDFLGSRMFQDIDADNTGKLWVSNYFGPVYCLDNEKGKSKEYTIQGVEVQGSAFTFIDSKDNKWISTAPGLALIRSGQDPDSLIQLVDFGKPEFRSMTIASFAEDNKGNIWLGAFEGLFMLEVNNGEVVNMHHFRLPLRNRNPEKMYLFRMYCDNLNQLWMTIIGEGLMKLDLNKNLDLPDLSVLPAVFVNDDRVPKNRQLSRETYYFVPDGNNNLLIRTDRGVEKFNCTTSQVESICSEGAVNDFEGNQGYWFTAMYYSQDHVLWLGTHNGLLKVSLNRENIRLIRNLDKDQRREVTVRTGQVLVDSRNRIWVGTPGNGLYLGYWNNQKQNYEFSHYSKGSNPSSALHGNSIYCLSETRPGEIWVGAGFIQKVVEKAQGVDFAFVFREKKPKISYSYQESVNQIIRFRDQIWVMYTNRGIRIYDSASMDFSLLRFHETVPFILYPYVQIVDGRRIFIRDVNGLYEISPGMSIHNKIWIPEMIDTLLVKPVLFPTGRFLITKRPGGMDFWLPSINDGLYRYYLPDRSMHDSPGQFQTQLVRHYTYDEGLDARFISDILEDKNGNLWVTTDQGLFRINPSSGVCYSLSRNEGFPGTTFSPGACTDRNELLYFCTDNGLISFHPDSLRFLKDSVSAYISEILLDNKPIQKWEKFEDVILPGRVKSFEFNHDQNNLTFLFSAVSFQQNKKIRFRYRLLELTDEWTTASELRTAIYQELKPGEYVFQVNASNLFGEWSDSVTSLNILIRAPFWKQGWFQILLIILAGIMIYIYIRLREKSLKSRNLQLEAEVKQRTDLALMHQKELEQMKSKFYTNISHEFRTPLTIINASTDELSKNENDKRKLSFLQSVNKASRQLLNLVNELLDLSKIEAGNLKLQVKNSDLILNLRNIWEMYLSEAERKGVIFRFNSELHSLKAWFDPVFLDKIIHNLISNALKFTGKGGAVDLLVMRRGSDNVEIQLIDTGKGIPSESLSKIFDRFYQVVTSDTNSGEGTGIGLAIVKELVEKHYGRVTVYSQPGKGSVFTVLLPISRHSFSDSEVDENQVDKDEWRTTPGKASLENSPDRLYSTEVTRIDPEKPVVLVVEDHTELRGFICRLLAPDYRLMEARNGVEGFEIVSKHLPELVLSDIMMPEMDGNTLCRQIKSNMVTCHIPVILLTAKADIESKLGGLEAGADDYLLKPFHAKELVCRCHNLIAQRQRLRHRFSGTSVMDPTQLTSNSMDAEFLGTAQEIILSNLGIADFSVQKLFLELGMSERTAQRKIKSITGLSPNEFIRTVRIKQAAKLLLDRKETISEVAYRTGFNSLSYFSRAFHDVMGLSPSEYLSRQN
ncbi:MAG: ATP-binding protein [Bacteroidales bacterium]